MEISKILIVNSGNLGKNGIRLAKVVSSLSKSLDIGVDTIDLTHLHAGSVNQDEELIIGSNVQHEGAYFSKGRLLLVDRHTELYRKQDTWFYSGDWGYAYLRDKGDIDLVMPKFRSMSDLRTMLARSFLPDENQTKDGRATGKMTIYRSGSEHAHMMYFYGTSKCIPVPIKPLEFMPVKGRRISIDDDFVKGRDVTPLMNLARRISDPSNSFELWVDPNGQIPLKQYTHLVKTLAGL
jgi:hypothetical protein